MKLIAITLLSILCLCQSLSAPGAHLGRSIPSFDFEKAVPEADLASGELPATRLIEMSSAVGTGDDKDEDKAAPRISAPDLDDRAAGTFLDHPEVSSAGESFRTYPANAWQEISSFFQTAQTTPSTDTSTTAATSTTTATATTPVVATAPKNNLILISSYVESIPFSGRIWALRTDTKDDPALLVSQLSKPAGICYDKTNFLLYVCDIADGKDGSVYQFRIKLNGDYSEQTIEEGTVVYKGLASDCVVDGDGSLYLADSSANQVIKILNPFLGLTIQGVETLYQNSLTNVLFSAPSAISITKDNMLMILNHGGSFDTGLMIEAPLVEGDAVHHLSFPIPGRGLAVCGDNAYYISGRTINSLNLANGEVIVLVKFEKYYTILDLACDDNNLYATDNAFGRIYVLPLDGSSVRMETVGYVSYARSMFLTTESGAERLMLALLAFLALQ